MKAGLRIGGRVPSGRSVRTRATIAALIGFVLSLTSCEGLLGADARPTTYVLRSINGSPLPVNLHYILVNGTDDGDWTFLADTMYFFPGGRGEWRGSVRFHAATGNRGSPDPGPRIDRYRRTFSYMGEGRTLTLFYHPCEDMCIREYSGPETIDRLQLRRLIGREWAYEQVRD